MRKYKPKPVVKELKRLVKKYGTVSAVAANIGVTERYMYMLRKGQNASPHLQMVIEHHLVGESNE